MNRNMKKIKIITSTSAFQEFMPHSIFKEFLSLLYILTVASFFLFAQPLIVWSLDDGSVPASSKLSDNREQIIQKEFDCIRQKKDNVIEWSDVCYATVGAQARADLINNTLESMEQNYEEDPKY